MLGNQAMNRGEGQNVDPLVRKLDQTKGLSFTRPLTRGKESRFLFYFVIEIRNMVTWGGLQLSKNA